MTYLETKRVFIEPDNFNPAILGEAAEILRTGGLVAFPTETVYGLGANALDAQACARIFIVKGRPQDNPLIVHVANRAMADRLVTNWPLAAEKCAGSFWPGPLTLVLPKTALVPDAVTGGLNTVALRMPDHPVAVALIEQAGVPVAAPSANISGKPSPTMGSHVWQDLQGKIPLIVDAGSCDVGLESTVLDVSGDIPVILRPGGIAKEQLEEILGNVEIDKPLVNGVPKAPGMKYRHYAPDGEMLLLVGKREKVQQRMVLEIHKAHAQGRKVGILCSLESASHLHSQLPDLLFVLGSLEHPQDVASSLFAGLRLCDERKMDLILAEGVDEGGLGLAIMNRLQKASGHRVIRV